MQEVCLILPALKAWPGKKLVIASITVLGEVPCGIGIFEENEPPWASLSVLSAPLEEGVTYNREALNIYTACEASELLKDTQVVLVTGNSP